MNKELIEALKKNEKPFGLMSKELQDWAKGMDWKLFLVYGDGSDGGKWRDDRNFPTWTVGTTYRLRPDYQPESGIVEKEIIIDDYERRYRGDRNKEMLGLDVAIRHEDFIGFKFEGDHVANNPVMYLNGENWMETTHYERVKSGESKTLHATHVLFRRSK